jgi:asparagine synthase (glutamine-hydrolysing)
MAEAGTSSPNTFTVSFEEKEFDESAYAGIIARKFKTNHTNILLKPQDFLEELPNALHAMDSPSGDGINTYVVSKAIRRQGMRVALSGVGGDELFAGYPIFSQYLQLQHRRWLWKLPGHSLGAAFLGSSGRNGRIKQLLRLPEVSIDQVYPVFRQILSPSLIGSLTKLPRNGTVHTALQHTLEEEKDEIATAPLLSQVSIAEYLGYTQHTLLKDTDQMSMAVSLEVREPFFDHDLVEFVLSIPDQYKNPVYPKSLLVESLKPLLPDEIVFRKKKGFLFPWELWLRNELRSFCTTYINQLAQKPFINGPALQSYWQKFLNGNKEIRWVEIWLFVVLGYWMERNEIE